MTVAATLRLALVYGTNAADGATGAALMDRGGMASSPRLMATRTIVPALILLLPVLAALPAAAQTANADRRREPSVTIDLSVLDQLGPPPNVADVLRGEVPAPQTALSPPSPGERKRHAERRHHVAAASTHPKPVPARRPVAAAAAPAAPPPDHVATAAATEPPPPPSALSAAGAVDAAPLAPPAPPPTQTAGLPTTEDAPLAPGPKPAAPAPIEPQGFRPTAVPAAPLPSQLPSATVGPDAKTAMIKVPSPPPELPTATVAPAALPAAPIPGSALTVLFAGKDTELSDDAKSKLDALIPRLTADDRARLQITGFAGGSNDDSNEARRISLQRTIIVRTYLAERGVANGRMDLRAKGNKEAPTPPDRVDIVMIDH